MTAKDAAKEIVRALPFNQKFTQTNHLVKAYFRYMGLAKQQHIQFVDNGIDHRTGYEKQVLTYKINGEWFKLSQLTRALRAELAQ